MYINSIRIFYTILIPLWQAEALLLSQRRQYEEAKRLIDLEYTQTTLELTTYLHNNNNTTTSNNTTATGTTNNTKNNANNSIINRSSRNSNNKLDPESIVSHSTELLSLYQDSTQFINKQIQHQEHILHNNIYNTIYNMNNSINNDIFKHLKYNIVQLQVEYDQISSLLCIRERIEYSNNILIKLFEKLYSIYSNIIIHPTTTTTPNTITNTNNVTISSTKHTTNTNNASYFTHSSILSINLIVSVRSPIYKKVSGTLKYHRDRDMSDAIPFSFRRKMRENNTERTTTATTSSSNNSGVNGNSSGGGSSVDALYMNELVKLYSIIPTSLSQYSTNNNNNNTHHNNTMTSNGTNKGHNSDPPPPSINAYTIISYDVLEIMLHVVSYHTTFPHSHLKGISNNDNTSIPTNNTTNTNTTNTTTNTTAGKGSSIPLRPEGGTGEEEDNASSHSSHRQWGQYLTSLDKGFVFFSNPG